MSVPIGGPGIVDRCLCGHLRIQNGKCSNPVCPYTFSNRDSENKTVVEFPTCTCRHLQQYHEQGIGRCGAEQCPCTRLTSWINPRTGIIYNGMHKCVCGHRMVDHPSRKCTPIWEYCPCIGFIPQ
jgi:hypothetical protein